MRDVLLLVPLGPGTRCIPYCKAAGTSKLPGFWQAWQPKLSSASGLSLQHGRFLSAKAAANHGPGAAVPPWAAKAALPACDMAAVASAAAAGDALVAWASEAEAALAMRRVAARAVGVGRHLCGTELSATEARVAWAGSGSACVEVVVVAAVIGVLRSVGRAVGPRLHCQVRLGRLARL